MSCQGAGQNWISVQVNGRTDNKSCQQGAIGVTLISWHVKNSRKYYVSLRQSDSYSFVGMYSMSSNDK